jgi:hypothetical protein
MTPAETLTHGVVGRAAHPRWATVIVAVMTITFLAALVGCCVVTEVPARALLLCAACLAFLGVVGLGFGTARCQACSRSVAWFSVTLDRGDAVSLVRSARTRGVQLRLPYRAGGGTCERVNVSGFACGRCLLLHVGDISDPSADAGT